MCKIRAYYQAEVLKNNKFFVNFRLIFGAHESLTKKLFYKIYPRMLKTNG
jgi:hypothetical protein